MRKITLLTMLFLLAACTEEQRNKITRQADNLVGRDYRVSYIDNGQIIKQWTVIDGKITSGKSEDGTYLGYYYFWTQETGYVQTPIERVVIEEIKN